MKKYFTLIYAVALILFSTSCLNKSADTNDVKLVTAAEMKSILELEEVQLIDVRSSAEYSKMHVASAQNIDFNSPTFDDDVSRLDKSKPVVLYCKGGGRSAKCAKKLKDAGFEKIYDLEGGLSKWEHSKLLSIEKQS